MNYLLKSALCGAAFLTMKLAGAAELTIHVDDLKTANGNVMIAVFDTEASFLKAPSKTRGAPASVAGNKVVFKDLPEGDYAFAVYHDANSNGKMDKNALGIPTEDYAFSNEALGKMGPPSYERAKFALPAAGATVRVTLK